MKVKLWYWVEADCVVAPSIVSDAVLPIVTTPVLTFFTSITALALLAAEGSVTVKVPVARMKSPATAV